MDSCTNTLQGTAMSPPVAAFHKNMRQQICWQIGMPLASGGHL